MAQEGARRKNFGTIIVLVVPPMFAEKHVEADILETIYFHKLLK